MNGRCTLAGENCIAYEECINPVSITFSDSPYTVPFDFSEINVSTAGGNVQVNVPVNRKIIINKTSSDNHIIDVYAEDVQIGELDGEYSSVIIENGKIIKDVPWFPYGVIVGVAGTAGDGGEILAKNRYGKTIFRGIANEDDSDVLEDAILDNRTICISSPLKITHSINIDVPYTTIYSLAHCILWPANDANCDIFHINGTFSVTLRDLLLHGNKENNVAGNGIRVSGAAYENIGPWVVKIIGCECLGFAENGILLGDNQHVVQTTDVLNCNCESNGIAGVNVQLGAHISVQDGYFEANQYGISANRCHTSSFRNNELNACSEAGMLIQQCESMLIDRPVIYYIPENKYGIRFVGGSDYFSLHNTIENGELLSFNSGVHFIHSDSGSSLRMTVENNQFYSRQDAENVWDVYDLDGANSTYSKNVFRYGRAIYAPDSVDSIISENRFVLNLSSPLNVHQSTIISNNLGYVTKNNGESVGTGEVQAVEHGLDIVPTRQQVILTAGSATANPYHSKAPDATYIYVVAGNEQPWYWNVP